MYSIYIYYESIISNLQMAILKNINILITLASIFSKKILYIAK